MVWQASPGRVATLAALTLVQGLVPTAMVWVSKLVVDGVVAAVTSGGDPAAMAAVVRYVGLQFLLGAAQILLGHATSIIQQRLADVVGHRLNVQVLARANALDLAHFETPGSTTACATPSAWGRSRSIWSPAGSCSWRATPSCSSPWWPCWRASTPCCPVIVLASLPSLLSQMYYGRFGWQLMHRQASLYRKQNYLASLMTSDSHAKRSACSGWATICWGATWRPRRT